MIKLFMESLNLVNYWQFERFGRYSGYGKLQILVININPSKLIIFEKDLTILNTILNVFYTFVKSLIQKFYQLGNYASWNFKLGGSIIVNKKISTM